MTIYDALGDGTLVGEAVERFYLKLTADPVLAEFFAGSDVADLKTHQRMFLTAALGGPDAYEGRDMRAAHAHLPITDSDFDLFLQHLAETLAETLAEVGTTSVEIAEMLEALAPLRSEIVSAPGEGSDEWGSVDPSGGSG